jgi:hypothetical protein
MKKGWKDERSHLAQATDKLSFFDICKSISALAVEKNLIENPYQGEGLYSYDTKPSSKERVLPLLWELVGQNVLYPILPESPPNPLFFGITEYGRKVISTNGPIPHDPDGYLAYLRREIPDLNGVIFRYVEESIRAYNINMLLSSTIAIGCAAEKALLLLFEVFIDYLPAGNVKKNFSTKTNDKIAITAKFEEFKKIMSAERGNINDKELADNADVVLNGLFNVLRQSRNSAGQPTAVEIGKGQAFANLQAFILYCKRVYALINYFKENRRRP